MRFVNASSMDTGDGARLVKLTVKETAQANKPSPLYTIEAIELDEKSPAAEWVGEIAAADGIDPRATRSVGDVLSLAHDVQNGKKQYDQPASRGNRGAYDPSTGTRFPRARGDRPCRHRHP